MITSVIASKTFYQRCTENHNPDLFYRIRSGLWVSESFLNLVVAKAGPTKSGTKFKIFSMITRHDATDAEIEEELGGESKIHLFEETQASAIIASFISRQSRGERGRLLNSGYANLLYLNSCVAYIYWRPRYYRWNVDACPRDECSWLTGFKIFSPGY